MTHPHWKLHIPLTNPELLGFLPLMLSLENSLPAREQFRLAYQHGGGWNPFLGFKFDPKTLAIKYPGDPPMKPIAETQLREERIFLYPYSWVLILQKDGTFEISRMD